MKRMRDKLFKRVTKTHRSWLEGVHASTYGGKTMPLETFGVTTRRLEILEDMGLVEYKNGLYILTELGLKERNP